MVQNVRPSNEIRPNPLILVPEIFDLICKSMIYLCLEVLRLAIWCIEMKMYQKWNQWLVTKNQSGPQCSYLTAWWHEIKTQGSWHLRLWDKNSRFEMVNNARVWERHDIGSTMPIYEMLWLKMFTLHVLMICDKDAPQIILVTLEQYFKPTTVPFAQKWSCLIT